jgi:hypothetical protein
MAINAKNVGKIGDQKTKKSSGATPPSEMKAIRQKAVEANKTEQQIAQPNLKANYRIERNEVKSAKSTETALLVNGKQKSIGRKSHYLLDMLTLDDE